MTIRGVILDVDGTLVDSNDAHARAWQEALTAHGYNVPLAQIRQLIGMGGDNLLPAAVQIEKDSPQGKRISEYRKRIFQSSYLPHLRPFPEARLFVERLCNDGMIVVVASSAEKSDVEPLLNIANVSDLIEKTISSADAPNSKPDPDLIHAALREVGYAPQEVIMVGDSPYDVQAAGKAGVRMVGLRCGGFSDQDLQGAIAIYDSPADALANYETSPFVMAG